MSSGRARPGLVVLSAPSGAGKTTIARRLVSGPASEERFVFSVSATTRDPRPGEVDGRDYHFVTENAFRGMIEADELLEWAEVHGRYYGTPRRYVDAAAERGEHALLDIDVQGALQVRERAQHPILVFVLPPSIEVLRQRLTGRRTESEAEIARRLRNARAEVTEAEKFDYLVVNEDLDRSVDAVRTIVRAHAYRREHAPGLEDRLIELRDGLDRLLDTGFASHEG